MSTSGSVSWNFERKGVVTVAAASLNDDDLLLACADAGADDYRIDGEVAEIYCAVEELNNVRSWFAGSGTYTVKSSELAMVPKDNVEITETSDAKKLLRVLDALEDNDDIQNVYSNWSMTDELMEEAAG